MASAKLSNPQTMNRYIYVVNNPLRYIDPDGLEATDPWSQLSPEEQHKLVAKLITMKEGEAITKEQLAEAGKAFNKLVTAYTADSLVDSSQTSANVASMRAFVAE